MTDLIELRVEAACRSTGVAFAKAWAKTPTAEIVAQERLVTDFGLGRYILVHRRSGLGMRAWAIIFDDPAEAVAAAERVEAVIDWSKIVPDEYDKHAVPAGWGEEEKHRVGALLEEIAGELDAKRAALTSGQSTS